MLASEDRFIFASPDIFSTFAICISSSYFTSQFVAISSSWSRIVSCVCKLCIMVSCMYNVCFTCM